MAGPMLWNKSGREQRVGFRSKRGIKTQETERKENLDSHSNPFTVMMLSVENDTVGVTDKYDLGRIKWKDI